MKLESFKISYDEALAMGPKEFVEKHLFPFMRRAEGRGFTMGNWIVDATPGKTIFGDGIMRSAPDCGTVCCIGGSMQILVGVHRNAELGRLLGLNYEQTNALFFDWTTDHNHRDGGCWPCWPLDLAEEFRKAKTPLEKEQVAEKMVLLAIDTKGACLVSDGKGA